MEFEKLEIDENFLSKFNEEKNKKSKSKKKKQKKKLRIFLFLFFITIIIIISIILLNLLKKLKSQNLTLEEIKKNTLKKELENKKLLLKRLKNDKIKLKIPLNLENLIFYRVHMEGNGWIDWSYDGKIGGIINKNKRLECINIFINSIDENWVDSLEYRVLTKRKGWTKWGANGNNVGTTGISEPLFNIQIKLDDKNNKKLYYKVYVNKTWNEWVKSGENATNTTNIKIEGIKIKFE